jgi:hypothetical protein
MRNILPAIFLVGATLVISSWIYTSANRKGKQRFLVTGSIMETVSYCGGAQPTQRILDSLNKPKGIPFGKLFVKQGLKNIEGAKIIRRITADANGNFSVYLPAGKYCLVEEWKSKPFKLPLKDAKHTIDSSCYRNLYNTGDFTLEIKNKAIHHARFVFHRTCSYNQPCITFHGNLPPAQLPPKRP